MLTYSNILQDTLAHGGGTYNRSLSGRAELPDTGYMVGVAKIAKIEYADENMNDIIKALDSARELVKGTENYIGTWLDDGFLYIDVSALLTDKQSAVDHCIANDELEYYDMGLKVSVAV